MPSNGLVIAGHRFLDLLCRKALRRQEHGQGCPVRLAAEMMIFRAAERPKNFLHCQFGCGTPAAIAKEKCTINIEENECFRHELFPDYGLMLSPNAGCEIRAFCP